MRRFDGRLARNVVGLCLPTVAVVTLGIFFALDKVPEIEKAERGRVREIYRETAALIRQNPAAYPTRRMPKDWKSCGQMKPGKWGYLASRSNGVTRVWYEYGAGQATFAEVPFEPETDYRTWFILLGSAVLLALVGVTVVGIRFFIGYMKSRDDFLSATAHDLTTPLIGLRMTIGSDDAAARRLNERLILLVDNIKDFLRLGGRRRKPTMTVVDIDALCREAYGLFASDYADQAGGPVDFPSGRKPVRVFADEVMTLQVLWNLFGNDLKYAAPFGSVSVRFSETGDGFVRVAFADAGQGMTRRQMRRAFDRYYRAKTVLETGKGGFGIGLCTSREFARAMGGDLTVRPNVPRGCVFTLTLRAVRPTQNNKDPFR